MVASKTYGLTHLAIAVKSIDRTMQFYQLVFDMEVMYFKDGFLQLTTPGCNDIIVFEERNYDLIGTTGGIAHFGFRLKQSESIHEIENNVRLAGGTIIEKGEFLPGSPYLYFKDPDSYTVEVWYELLQ